MNKPTVTNQTNAAFAFNPVLDVEFLQSIYDNDFAYAREVFGNFLQETGRELQEIQNAFEQADIKTVRTKLHKIKPTFSLVGLSFITDKTELLIKECDLAASKEDINLLYINTIYEIHNWLPVIKEEFARLNKL